MTVTDALIYSVTHANGGGPIEGDTLWHALNWAVIVSPEDLYREYQQRFTLLQSRYNADPYALSARENAERSALLGALIDNLIELLRNGTLVAKGFRAGSLELVEIPAAWWTNVLCNVEENWVESGGVRITGVLVYHPKAKPRR